VTDIVMKASSCHLPPALVLRGALALARLLSLFLSLPPSFSLSFSLSLSLSLSLSEPRPVQDSAGIARKGPAGEKKESNPYEISSLGSSNIARDSCADLIRDCYERSLITPLIIE